MYAVVFGLVLCQLIDPTSFPVKMVQLQQPSSKPGISPVLMAVGVSPSPLVMTKARPIGFRAGRPPITHLPASTFLSALSSESLQCRSVAPSPSPSS